MNALGQVAHMVKQSRIFQYTLTSIVLTGMHSKDGLCHQPKSAVRRFIPVDPWSKGMVPNFQPTPISCYLESQLKCRMVFSFHQETFLPQKTAQARVNMSSSSLVSFQVTGKNRCIVRWSVVTVDPITEGPLLHCP